MKHVGLNVAADPLFTSVYTGLPGGLVVLSADDPGCHSSQNEQDNRYYARFASLPCFEPVSAQEAKDMTREAFRLARELQQPVLLRTTTRVSHMRGNVEFDDLPAGPAPIVDFQRNPGRFVPVPAVARGRHRSLLEIMEKARAFAESSRFSREYGPEGCRLGIIASGVARNYLADALASGGWEERVRVLELGMTWPLPEGRIEAFLQSCDQMCIRDSKAGVARGQVQACGGSVAFRYEQGAVFGSFLCRNGKIAARRLSAGEKDFVRPLSGLFRQDALQAHNLTGSVQHGH